MPGVCFFSLSCLTRASDAIGETIDRNSSERMGMLQALQAKSPSGITESERWRQSRSMLIGPRPCSVPTILSVSLSSCAHMSYQDSSMQAEDFFHVAPLYCSSPTK